MEVAAIWDLRPWPPERSVLCGPRHLSGSV